MLQQIIEQAQKMEEKEVKFGVVGAGFIKINSVPLCSCGTRYGFSIGVSWGRFGYTPGVIPIAEAKKLAEHILAKIKEMGLDETEIRIQARAKMVEDFGEDYAEKYIPKATYLNDDYDFSDLETY